MMRSYGNDYGARRGRYSASGGYGRRGGYRGYGYLDEMNEQYGNYNEGKEAYRRGNYGAGQDSIKSLEYMLKSVCQFMKMLKEDAESPEEAELIQEYSQKIGEM